jgi:hypothetical protein
VTAQPHLEQRFFEDIEVGEELESIERFDRERVERYFEAAKAWGAAARQRDGRFTNLSEARRNGLERPMVPGPLSQAMINRMLVAWMGPYGRLHSLDLSFRRPVLQNDLVHCVILVTDADDDSGLISLDVTLENESGERAVLGTATLELPRRD